MKLACNVTLLLGIVNEIVADVKLPNVTEFPITVQLSNTYPAFGTAVSVTVLLELCVPTPSTVPAFSG